jgi:hypothetical protein
MEIPGEMVKSNFASNRSQNSTQNTPQISKTTNTPLPCCIVPELKLATYCIKHHTSELSVWPLAGTYAGLICWAGFDELILAKHPQHHTYFQLTVDGTFTTNLCACLRNNETTNRAPRGFYVWVLAGTCTGLICWAGFDELILAQHHQHHTFCH